MKLTKSFTSLALIFSLSFISFLTLPVQTAQAQDARIALQRGYRTGYSDGYMAGYRDAIDNASRSYVRHSEYTKADRAYSKEYGAIEDYRDGYQQGFEAGYDTGYEKRSFDATLPAELNKRGSINTGTSQTSTIVDAPNSSGNTVTTETPTSNQPTIIKTKSEDTGYTSADQETLVIGADTELIVELIDELTTERSREGDKFTARVISPMELSGALIEGRVNKIQKPGRLKRRAEILLSFDRMVLPDGRWANFSAILTEVLPVRGDNVRKVDVEGTVEGKGSLKEDGVKVGAATGTGTVVGAIAGGPVGAAVGAGVGAAFGVGAVVMDRGKHIRLNKSQQLRIRSSYETRIK